MKDVFVKDYPYTCIHCMSLMFGTLMTFTSKTHKIVAHVISLFWCLVVVGNQIDYVMKPWIEEQTEINKQDTAFEKIIRFDFWTYNAVYFFGCLFPLISRKIEVNALRTPKSLVYKTRRIVIILILVVANLLPAIFSNNLSSLQKKTGSMHNLLLQDFCKLGILTIDLQFVWFCWSLKDRFSKLNDNLHAIVSSEARSTTTAVWKKITTQETRNNYEIRHVNIVYRHLMDSVKTVVDICEERILMNILCYMFNTIRGLFDTISAYRAEGTSPLLVVVHLLWVANCAGRITLVCSAASSVVEQDDRLHHLAQLTNEALSATKNDNLELKQLVRRLEFRKVKFDVCGMVTIDKTLLSSAVISVISYLVIVLQYNYS